ncbi:MAG: OB-fold domain-containing protein, partial [candidate division WOR-3 bacterium]
GKNFPGVNGVIDFEDGGRLVCELTDCLPEQVQPGIAVEMTLRRFSEYETITYFWKARPVRF